MRWERFLCALVALLVGVSRPGLAQPAGAKPAGAKPAGAKPAGAQPAGAKPAGAQPAGAKPAGEPPSSCRAPASISDPEAWLALGQELGQAEETQCSLQAYLKAFELLPSYDSSGSAGVKARALGQHTLACRMLSYSLDHIPASLPPEQQQAARERLMQELEQSLRHVGRVHIQATPGAQISVDGAAVGLAPLDPPQLCLWPGSHKLGATLAGHVPREQVVRVLAGLPDAVNLTLAVAEVEVAAEPPAAEPPAAEPGAPAEGPSALLVMTGSVVAVAVLGAGAGLLATSAGAAGDRDGKLAALGGQGSCTAGTSFLIAECDAIRELDRDAQSLRGSGIALLIAGGVVGAATLGYALWPRETAAETAAVAVFPAGLGGLLIRGTF